MTSWLKIWCLFSCVSNAKMQKTRLIKCVKKIGIFDWFAMSDLNVYVITGTYTRFVCKPDFSILSLLHCTDLSNGTPIVDVIYLSRSILQRNRKLTASHILVSCFHANPHKCWNHLSERERKYSFCFVFYSCEYIALRWKTQWFQMNERLNYFVCILHQTFEQQRSRLRVIGRATAFHVFHNRIFCICEKIKSHQK